MTGPKSVARGPGGATVRASGHPEAEAGLIHRPGAAGDHWLLGDEELFNGCILEMRLLAPAVWLQVRIVGLPEAPKACFHLADETVVHLPLTPGATVRWPRHGVDAALLAEASAADQPASSIHIQAAKPKNSR